MMLFRQNIFIIFDLDEDRPSKTPLHNPRHSPHPDNHYLNDNYCLL